MTLPPPDVLDARARRLRAALVGQQLDALLITSLPNVAYLTGFFASAAALVATLDVMQLISDARYSAVLEKRAYEWPVVKPTVMQPGQSYDAAIVDALTRLSDLRVGFEASHLTVRRHLYICDGLAKAGWTTEPIPTEGVVEALRIRKDPWEIITLREGATRLSRVAKCILSKSLAGRTESDVAAEIDAELRRAGFERPAFDTIVAAGSNGALPHARAGSRCIEAGDLVVVDFGGVLNGYCTDLTRTVPVHPVPLRQRQLVERVIEAQAAAFAAVGPGVAPEAVDRAARESLQRHGLADAFSHGTGHGLGLEVHEAPRVTKARADQAEPPLAAGMVMTLEPGVYFPGECGVRIEDDVLVTDSNAEWLTDRDLVIA